MNSNEHEAGSFKIKAQFGFKTHQHTRHEAHHVLHQPVQCVPAAVQAVHVSTDGATVIQCMLRVFSNTVQFVVMR